MTPPPINRKGIPASLADLFDEATAMGHEALIDDFLAAVAVLNAGWTAAEIEQALRRDGNLGALLDSSAGQEIFADFRNEMRDSYEGIREPDGRRINRHRAPIANVYVSASDAAAVSSPIRADWWNLDRWTTEATTWVERTVAQRVTLVSESTKQGIRDLVAEAFGTGADRDWIARTMEALDGDGTLRLGLDKARNKALLKYIDEELENVPRSRRKGMIQRRYEQLLRSRAKTIAQTEVVQVANTAQMATYQAAAFEGELDAGRYILEWVTRAIGCPRCIAMDGATREISSGQFVSDGSGPLGVEFWDLPEMHPNGWCFTRVVLRSEATRLPVL